MNDGNGSRGSNSLLEERRVGGSKRTIDDSVLSDPAAYRSARLSGETAIYEGKGLTFERYFTKEGVHPFDAIEWAKADARTYGSSGKIKFEQKGVEVPKTWSQESIDVCVSRYFRQGNVPTESGKEESVKQIIERVAKYISVFGSENGYFANRRDADIFEDELTHILVNQMAAFNSPVWFNAGNDLLYGMTTSSTNWARDQETGEFRQMENAYERPQSSACFIQKIDDSMEGILDQLKREGMLFKLGSGTGTNFSSLRAKGESLSNGGSSSGMMSFLDIFDANAGAIQSGGTTRRAAKMIVVDADHPEIEEFIEWKAKERKKMLTLIGKGYSDDEAADTVGGQNANNSIRVTDEFMEKVLNNEDWNLIYRKNRGIAKKVKAGELFNKIAINAHYCAEPGMQFDTKINDWHTCPNTGRINASNPCSEYMFLDDTACNLACTNLIKF